MAKELIFLDDLGQPFEFLKEELRQWPSPRHDDILDTIADLFFDKARYGRQIPRVGATPRELLMRNEEEAERRMQYAMAQYREKAIDRLLSGSGQARPEDVHSYYRVTGGF
jgi:hypothetical protein